MVYRIKYSKDCLILSKLNSCPKYQYNLSVNGMCLCPEKLSGLGRLSKLLVPELNDLYCTRDNGIINLCIYYN